MSFLPDPGGKGGGSNTNYETFKDAAAKNLSTMTPAMGGDSGDSLPRRMRTFAEILNEEQNHRNILEVK